jgi:hypothetical protein
MIRYCETTFDDYLIANKKVDLHPELVLQSSAPSNMIFYGPAGVGKYTQMLKYIFNVHPHTSVVSPHPKDKKLSIIFNKQEYLFKISSMHFEIDMGLLGCNSKLLWHEIFTQIMEIISTRTSPGIASKHPYYIVCKNFHVIHNELLDIFYSYMQQSRAVKYILITEHVSFIPEEILNTCRMIHIKRPSKAAYQSIGCVGSAGGRIPPQTVLGRKSRFSQLCPAGHSCEGEDEGASRARTVISSPWLDITCPTQRPRLREDRRKGVIRPMNIKYLKTNAEFSNTAICNAIATNLMSNPASDFNKLRNHIYNILTYHLDIAECIWHIIQTLYLAEHGSGGTQDDAHILLGDCSGVDYSGIPNIILHELYVFFKQYNNNYRPIYHIERFLLLLVVPRNNAQCSEKG